MRTFLLLFLLFCCNNNILAAEQQDCKSCHQVQVQAWAKSHHGKAMQLATPDTVLGNFDDQEITINGVTSRFFRKGNEYWVRTEGEDGRLKAYKVDYTFGFTPLQQYLVKTVRGKYQVLPLTWDSRPGEEGGQRWYHIYGDDPVSAQDRLHWSQPLQNWNGMCADCHSVGLKRNYDPDKDQFNTRWQDINVSCAACHGKMDEDHKSTSSQQGAWTLKKGDKTVHWQGEIRDQSQIGNCAACHSRRAPLTDGFTSDDKFLDSFSPSLILPPDYFPDGQIRDEVYVWGSFLQSKMYGKGVICSDCHNPHSLTLKARGNDLCGQCHQPQYFDTPKHHHHAPASKGGQCINCHMPERTYMGVDRRRDHSFRLPRPDVSLRTGSPNACVACHDDRTDSWAQEKLTDWYGEKHNQPSHYGDILSDILVGKAGAEQRLAKLIKDADLPPIIRASGYQLLGNYPDSIKLLAEGLTSSEPLIRLGAVRGLVGVREKRKWLYPILKDTYRAIRVEVVRAIGEVTIAEIPATYQNAYGRAEQELLTAEQQSAWRGEGRANLALFYRQRGKKKEAIKNYIAAINMDPYFAASYVNLADIYKTGNFDDKGGELLRRGLLRMPDDADLNFAQALFLIRQKQQAPALVHLEKAVKFAPQNARYAYVYAVALNDLGQPQKATGVIRDALSQMPDDGNLNYMMMVITFRLEQYEAALKYAQKLNNLYPDNLQIREQLTVIRKKIAGQE